MNEDIQTFLSNSNYVLYGVSSDSKKFGNYIYKELTQRKFSLSAIYKKNLDGINCFRSISEIPTKPNAAIICTKPVSTLLILDELYNNRILNIWLQQGSESPEVIAKAKEYNLNIISNKCILMYAEPVKSIHKFHRTINKILGKY